MKRIRARYYPDTQTVVVQDGSHTITFSCKCLSGVSAHLRTFNLRMKDRWRDNEAQLEHIMHLSGRVR